MRKKRSNADLKVANIQFTVPNKYKRKFVERNIQLITPFQEGSQVVRKDRRVIRNSFIPSTNIKSQVLVERVKKYAPVSIPVFAFDTTLAKFPMRKPKSNNKSYHLGTNRASTSFYSYKNSSHVSQQSLGGLERGDSKIWMRPKTKSCLILSQNSSKKQSFIRYSNLSVSSDYNYSVRASTERENVEK